MPVPTFNGVAIFGAAWKLRAGQINPVASQVNAYPALDGLESLKQGKRGGRALATGRLGGYGAAGLNAAQNLFRSYHDGFAYILIDQFGNAWPFTKLESFEATGPITTDPATGWLWQPYQATFVHLLV
jgi:hypothetical protein